MSGKSRTNTPSKKSTREPKKTDASQVKTPKASKTPSKNSTKFDEIIGHKKYDTYYVEYQVRLKNGETIKATEFEFDKNAAMLADYKRKVTNQTDDSNGEYVVEKIITHRMVDDEPLFLVQWKGFPHPVWNSEMWEKDLGNCKPLLKSYKTASGLSASSKTPKQTPKKSKAVPKHKATMCARKSVPVEWNPYDDDDEDDDEDEDEDDVYEAAASSTPKRKNGAPAAKKAKLAIVDNADSDNDEIERVEEIQSEDDDEIEEEENGPSTSSAPAASGSTWSLNFWRWF